MGSSSLQCDWIEQMIDRSSAISERLHRNANFIQQRQMKIRQWRWLIKLNMPTSSMLPGSTTCDDDWQIGVIVRIWISHSTSIQKQRVVQQIAVPFFGRFQFDKEFSEQ